MRTIISLFLLTIAVHVTAAEATMDDTSRYKSIFGKNVLVFSPEMDMNGVQRTLDALHAQQAKNHIQLLLSYLSYIF